MRTLKIEVLVAEKATGSWKAITEQATRILGHAPTKDRDGDNKMCLMYGQESLCLLQPDFERGVPVQRREFAPKVKIHKGDWLLRTTFGALVLTATEYKEFVL